MTDAAVTTAARHRFEFGTLFAASLCVSIAQLSAAACHAGEQKSQDLLQLEAVRKDRRLSVAELSKNIDAQATKEQFVLEGCRAWTLTANDVKEFFARAQVLTGEEWHTGYDELPCDYTGVLAVEGVQYRFQINAAGYGVVRPLSQPAAVVWYGCKRGCDEMFSF